MLTSAGFLLFIIPLLFLSALVYFLAKKKKPIPLPDRQVIKKILLEHVLFYKRLNDASKIVFEEKVEAFLKKIRITPVKTTVEDIDRVFAAAAAIIPIFAFEGWEYRNIHEILLYPDSFNDEFKIYGQGRNVLGMVGNGAMQNVMLLSQQDLRAGFRNTTDQSNTAIHEFVHLIDKTDGATDGAAEAMLAHQYALPWLKQMHQEILLIRENKSDINPYGATNEAEFLAVASEYFFEQPHLMKEKHPELFRLLEQTFKTPSK